MKKNALFRTIAMVMALVMLLTVGSIAAFGETKPNFKQYLSPKRIAVDPPESLVDENGKAHFGTFNAEIKNINLTDIKGQSDILPDSLNSARLTQWEALEVSTKDFTMLSAIQELSGIGAVTMTLVYKKDEKKLYSWTGVELAKDGYTSKNLFDGAQTVGNGLTNKLVITNDFNHGKAHGDGRGIGTDGMIQYHFDLDRVSKPSVICCPFGDNKPLYTQKDLFKCKGYLVWNDKMYETDEEAVAIIDDHKGYYPYNAYYDWVTTMGKLNYDGGRKYFGINLTDNQSTDPYNYNEDLIWLENDSSRLTPVKFDHPEYNHWTIRDQYGMTNLQMIIGDRNLIQFDLGVIKMNYHITFGTLQGYVYDENGNKYDVSGMPAIGEIRDVRM